MKIIAILLLFALVLSCCACTGEPDQQTTDTSVATEATAEATESAGLSELTPEQLYGHINQLELTDGVYKIWSEVGVQNMADHPDATFELLCNVDMEGATLAPIGTASQPFTGEIKGGNFTIFNFTIAASQEGNLGFVGVNKGIIRNLLLENAVFAADANARNIGTLAGTNEGDILRCTVTGTLTVQQAADGASCGSAVGINTGEISNTVVNVDLAYTAAGSAAVGGIAGTMEGGRAEYNQTTGKLEIEGTNKVTGLLAGDARNTELRDCVFLGETNTVDGKLFTNYVGTEENVSLSGCLWRDNEENPLPENVQKLRDTVVQAMYEMGTIEWHVSERLEHSCSCNINMCHGVFTPEITYVGLPYNHKAGSMSRFLYCVDDNNVVESFVHEMGSFDGMDMYMGNDCSSAVMQAWFKVGNSFDFKRTAYMAPRFDLGTIPVGDWEWDLEYDSSSGYTKYDTMPYILATGEERMYEAYAQLRKGDAIVYVSEGAGHTRMVAEDPVIVRDESGKIDPEYSYILMHEQGVGALNEETFTYSTWRIHYKYTFANLLYDAALPVTIEELLTGEMEAPAATLEDGAVGKPGLTAGKITANYYLDNVNVAIKDSQGETVFDKLLWTTVGKYYDAYSNDILIRTANMEYDLANVATALADAKLRPGEDYSYTITANLGTGDSVLVKEGSFTNGNT